MDRPPARDVCDRLGTSHRVRLEDADLDKPFVWEEYDDDGVRFALLTAHHLLRETTATVAAARLGAGKPFTEAQRILAQVHEAYLGGGNATSRH